MGGTNSRPSLKRSTTRNDDTSSTDGNPVFRRSSKRRQSKSERANTISMNLQKVKSEIEQFDGFRGDSRYQSIQTELTQYSQEVQDVKSKSKTVTKDVCSNIQADIVDLLRKLEEIVEKNEGALDLAAVESHSFIDQTPNLKKKVVVPVPEQQSSSPKPNNIARDRDMMNISELEESTNNLMKEINRAIELENTSEFVVFEKKIGILYADLTTIDIEKDDPLYERKESISRKLIRYNNKLKSYKNRNSIVLEKENSKIKKAEKELQIINQIEESLVDLELKVAMFEDVKSDPKYRELDQILKGYWAKLQGLDDSSEESRRKKLKTINLIKTYLQTLNNKAEDNATKIKADIEKINNLEDDVSALKVVVEGYQGFKNDLDYTNIDQTIRSLWAKLNDVHSSNSKVEQKKNETIKIIQGMLITLSENAEKYEAKVAKGREKLNAAQAQANVNGNVKGDKLVEELNDFKDQWRRLSSDIEKYLTIENQTNVETVLTTVQSDISTCIMKLPDKLDEYKRKNTGDKKSGSNQSLNKAHRSSITVAKNKEEKMKNKSISFQPQEQLLEELSTSYSKEEKGKRASSVEQIIDEIENLQSKLKIITADIQNCPPNECSNYRAKLEEVEQDLNNIETNLKPVVTDSKREVMNTIQAAYKMIDERSKKDSKEETTKLKVIIENLQKLKKKVDCFSGTHGNIQYTQIENELGDCMKALDAIDCKDNEKLQANKKQIRQKINHYLNILDERSLKVSSQDDIVAEVKKEEESIVKTTNELVNKLTEIRSMLESYDANAAHNFEEDFDRAKVLLNRIDDSRNAEYYEEYLNQLVAYYQSKTAISPLLNLEQIVNNLKLEASELENIVLGNQNINQRISATLTQIRNLPAHGESETLKSKLMHDIKTVASLLQTKDIILKDLDVILEEINRFSGPDYKKRYDEIDEKLSAVFLKVQGIPIDTAEEYIHLRNNLIQKIQNHKKKLNAKMASVKELEGELDGTEI